MHDYERFDMLIVELMTTSREFTVPIETLKNTLPFLIPMGINADFAFCKMAINRIESISAKLKYGICTEILHSKDNSRTTALRVKIVNIRR